MLNEIMDAITRRLDELFPDCRIYTDEVRQDLREPCFFVQFLEPSEKPMIGRRYFRETEVAVQYFPQKNSRRERNQVLDTLIDGMEAITLPDGRVLWGTNRRGQEEEGILHFFVNFNVFLLKEGEKTEPMEDLEWRGESV